MPTGRDETGVEVVDVSHEALIRGWPRLRGWIDADRAGLLTHRRLSDAAREWDSLKHESAALYRGARLGAASEWASDHADALSELERDFLTVSQATERSEFEAAKRRTRRLRLLATGLAAVTVIVAVLGVVALDQRTEARRETAKATSLALAASSVAPLRTRPDVSLALAFDAYRKAPQPEASSAVIRALLPARRSRLHGVLTTNDQQNDIAFSPDGRTLASASGDRTVRLWDATSRKPVGRLSGHTESVLAVAFSPDGRTLASASSDRTVRLWDAAIRKPIGRLSGHTDSVRAVAFSPDGRTLASASSDRTVRLWDAVTRRPLGRLTGHTESVFEVAFSPDGRTLASASSDNTVRLWNTDTLKPLGRLTPATPTRSSRSRSALTGRRSPAPASTTRCGCGMSRPAGRWAASLVTPAGCSRSRSPGDGRTLVSASFDKTVRLWGAASRKPVGRLSGHTESVLAVAFSPDGRTLASASSDNTVRLWNPATRKPLGRLTGHTDAIFEVAFSPDGKTLASASSDKTVRLWNTDTLKHLGSLTGHTDSVRAVAFNPDGKTLASASSDNTVRVWEGVLWRSVTELRATVCDILLAPPAAASVAGVFALVGILATRP